MKERPILFKGEMVRAILSGQKTQARRVVNLPAGWEFESPPVLGRITSPHPKKGRFGAFILKNAGHELQMADLIPCPYGQPGDRLWVRECFADPCYRTTDKDSETVLYRADGKGIGEFGMDEIRWKPSIHMPRWACRIVLEIVSVRVERLHLISRGDAMEEGCPFPNMAGEDDPRQWFLELWESINGPESCAANPWVWVVEFKRVS